MARGALVSSVVAAVTVAVAGCGRRPLARSSDAGEPALADADADAGADGPGPDLPPAAVEIVFTGVVLDGNATFDGHTLAARDGGAAAFSFLLTFRAAGHFLAALTQESGASGWLAQVSTPLPGEIVPDDLGKPRSFSFAVVAPSGAAVTAGTVRLAISDERGTTSVVFAVRPLE